MKMLHVVGFGLLLLFSSAQCDPVEKVYAIEGENVKLVCKITGLQPTDSVQWRFITNEQSLSDKRIGIEHYNVTEGTSTLIIESVNYEDSGDYFCQSSGQTIRTSSTITLIVPPPLLIRAQGYPFNRSFYEAVEGEEVILFCYASGRVKAIRWLDDNSTHFSDHNHDIFDPLFTESLKYQLEEGEEYDANMDITVSALSFLAQSFLDGLNFTCQVWYDDHIADYASIQLFVDDKAPLSWLTMGLIIAGVIILFLGALCVYYLLSGNATAWDMDIQLTTVPVPGIPFPGPMHSTAPVRYSGQLPNQVHTTGQGLPQVYIIGQGPTQTNIPDRGPSQNYI